MKNADVLEKIVEILEERKGEDGWTNLAAVGKPLSEAGIHYRESGCLNLRELLEKYDDCIEIRIDKTTHRIPVLYARKKSAGQHIQNTIFGEQKRDEVVTIPKRLLQWAWLGDFRQVISDLKDMALKERWYYKYQNPSFPFPILSKYVKYTFYRLSSEANKIRYSSKYAAFNTGLVNNLYEPIYALFEQNRIPDKQEWYFHEFCVSGVGLAGKILASHFNPLPERANYFHDPAELIYDSNAPEPQLNWDHIILDNVSRLPHEFLEDNKPTGFAFKNTSDMTREERFGYYTSLASAIKNDSRRFRAIKNRLADSLNLALKRVEWNFKTAIPMYYPANNKMSLLLPLSLVDDDKIDLALVTEKTQSGNYLGHTVLPLDWAYSNARLIARPDSDWLVADRIETEVYPEMNEESD